jgi:hypothetical protein
VRYRSVIRVLMLACAVVSFTANVGTQTAAPGEQFIGTWTGTWDGAGTGGFELTLEKDKDGALAGRVSITGEPTYKATLKTISFDGNKMSAKYDFTPDERAEVVLAATFEGKTSKGTWTLRDKASATEVATGGFTVDKK